MHAWGRLVVAGLAGTAALAALASPAHADGTGDAWTDGTHVGIEASSGGSGDAVTGGGGRSNCEWVGPAPGAGARRVVPADLLPRERHVDGDDPLGQRPR